MGYRQSDTRIKAWKFERRDLNGGTLDLLASDKEVISLLRHAVEGMSE
jgi:hypothetical protein